MVTLDGNLSNPLDQKLHTLLGHHQYISPIHHYHLHNPYNSTYNNIPIQPLNTLNHMDMHDACGLMQAKLVDFPRSDLV